MRTNYDETFCGKLPLHQSNLIQPHGLLLVVSKENINIIQASENVFEFFNLEASKLIDRPLKDVLDQNSFDQFSKLVSGNEDKATFSVVLNNQSHDHFLALLHITDHYYLLEIELKSFVTTEQHSFMTVFQKVKNVMSSIDKAQSIEEVCEAAAREIKAVSGFDKVMIYSFDKNWNGDVIAEAAENGMDRYLGLKFPASDIPKPARDMYFKNPYRLIPDRNYVPVRLYPLLNSLTHTFTDLTASNLRSVAAVHLEYLKNMEVMASMSTRIVCNDTLWGLIACHHRSPKFLSFEECSVFELLSNLISSRLTTLTTKEQYLKRRQLNQGLTNLVDHIYHYNDVANAIEENKEQIMQFLHADGLAYSWNGTIGTCGTTPEKHEIENLCFWLADKAPNEIYQEAALPLAFDDARRYAQEASGLLSLPIQAEKGNFIMAFRPEVIKKIEWGGNPDDAVVFEKNSQTYHPRNSFDQWQEIVQQTAQAWETEEIVAAEEFRKIVVEFTLNKMY